MTDIITRFAPSPTGNLHLGSARTALINYIVSKQNPNSKFYLRIEDTDKKRSQEKYKENILDSLLWLGINWDSDLQIQSKQIERHKEVAKNLLNNNKAYKCICDETKLQKKRELILKNNIKNKKICSTCKDDVNIQKLSSNYVVRLKIPSEGITEIKDLVQGKVVVKNQEIDDYIILRVDGTPTYMLSVVVDDHDLGVNFIIRGNDHLNNAFRQKYIYKFMNWNEPNYAHIPLIHGEDGAKLSKRHGAVNIQDLKNKGYLPISIINNLILLGWSANKDGNEMISLVDIIKKFNLKNITKSSSIFSYEKLDFFNNHYLRLDENLHEFINYCYINSDVKKYINKDKDKLLRIFEIYKKDINFYNQILNYSKIYFDNKIIFSEKNQFDDIFNKNYNEFFDKIKIINSWSRDNLASFLNDFLKEKKIKFPIFGKPLRFILTNLYEGPSINDILFILGKKESIERLNKYITNN
tara:strand:- start:1807 stop:3210 length:1404 start_codon:yes stop_codon:yes gene_type:complete